LVMHNMSDAVRVYVALVLDEIVIVHPVHWALAILLKVLNNQTINSNPFDRFLIRIL